MSTLKYFPIIRGLFFVCLVITLTSCKKPVRVFSYAYADTTDIPNGLEKGKSFTVVYDLEEGECRSNLQSKELCKKIGIILGNKGYVVKPWKGVEGFKDVDYVLFFDYRMKSETETVNVLRYVPGQLITSFGNYNGQTHTQTISAGNYMYVPESHTYYHKFFSINIYEGRKCCKSKEEIFPPALWYGFASATDCYANLRENLDFLLLELFDLLGKNTTGTVDSYVYDNDAQVVWLRKAYLNPDELP